MHIFFNALGASAASGLTYLRNVLPQLAKRSDIQTTVAVSSVVQPEFSDLKNISFARIPRLHGTAQRFWFEQMQLPQVIREAASDVLIAAGNFALRKSPVPQILLSGNSLYLSNDFYRDLLARREYGLWLDTQVKAHFAKKSISWADRTVAPSHAFARELHRWTGKPVESVYHGFDRDIFFSDESALPASVRCKIAAASNDLKLLYVSHYNYFRSFEVLFRAIPLIRERLGGRKVRLFLTCKLKEGQNPGRYRTESASRLVEQLGIRDEVVELGAVLYRQLHHLYCACDLYVTSSYAETFAHPLVEAKACGLPIVASDLPVHREVAGDSALYFARFSPQELAERVMEAASATKSECRNAQAAVKRFSWSDHVDQILALAATLVPRRMAA